MAEIFDAIFPLLPTPHIITLDLHFIIAFTVLIGIKMIIDKQSKFLKNYLIVFFVLTAQVLLGIFTLVSGLNLYLASLHQITSVILVFTVLNLNHKLS